MPRAFWKGAINFALVVIPVRMAVAARRETPRFHLLHKKDLTRPKQVWHCPQDGEYFSLRDTVRGYEYARGRYVVLKEADFEKVPLRTTHSIDIMGFVEGKEIDPIYYDSAYYLEPEDIGARAYSLFRDALAETGRVGLGKVALQRREHLCVVRPTGGTLALHTMFFAREIRPAAAPPAVQGQVRPEEVRMARSLITEMAMAFNPQEYRDEYRAALEKLVQAKVEGKEIAAPEEARAELPDLLSALRESIAAARRKAETQAPAGAR